MNDERDQTHCSNGLVRVPHQVKKTDRPTVSNSLAKMLTPTCSNARFSTNSWLKNYWGPVLAKGTKALGYPMSSFPLERS